MTYVPPVPPREPRPSGEPEGLLENSLLRAAEWTRANQNALLVGACVVALIVAVVLWSRYQSRLHLEQGYAKLAGLGEATIEELRELDREYSEEPLRVQIKYRLAIQLYERGLYDEAQAELAVLRRDYPAHVLVGLGKSLEDTIIKDREWSSSVLEKELAKLSEGAAGSEPVGPPPPANVPPPETSQK